MNKLIEPKSLLEVRKWKRQVSNMIDRYGLKEVERRASMKFQKALEEVRKKRRTAKAHS